LSDIIENLYVYGVTELMIFAYICQFKMSQFAIMDLFASRIKGQRNYWIGLFNNNPASNKLALEQRRKGWRMMVRWV